MVGLISDSTVEEEASKIKNPNPSDPIDSSVSDSNGLHFSSTFDDESFMDFDNLEDWIGDIPEPDKSISDKVGFLDIEDFLKMVEDNSRVNDGSAPDVEISVSVPVISDPRPVLLVSDPILDEPNVEIKDCEGLGSLNHDVDEELEDISGPVSSESNRVVDESSGEVSNLSSLILKEMETVNLKEDMSDEESESSSSEESKSSSSDEEDSDDDDASEIEEKKKKVKKEKVDASQIEEGEIREDGEDDDEEEDVIYGDDEEEGIKGPIKSRNEVQFLPPVPPVQVTLQPSHQTVPVGIVLSCLGAQVVVDGAEHHSPLNEGSILWITETRVPLGVVDEIFGPVKHPYYVVRFNSETEIPVEIHEGTQVSFVPEFASHVLNDMNVYKKGYDASGENDEEVLDEAEFSDDEKEAEYRRSMKAKRGKKDQTPGNKRNNNKKNCNGNRDGNSKMEPQTGFSPGPINPEKIRPSVVSRGAPSDHGTPSLSPQVAPLSQQTHIPGHAIGPNGFWMNGGMVCQPQPGPMFPAQNMAWPQQNIQYPPYQTMPMQNGMVFQQQPFDFNNQTFLPNLVVQGGQPNCISGPGYAPWAGVMPQNSFNPAMYPMGFHPSQNVGGQGISFQNIGGQGVLFQNTGGAQGGSFPNMGAQGGSFPNTGAQGGLFPNTGAQGGPFQNTGGQGGPFQFTGAQRAPFQAAPSQNTGGQRPPFQGGQGPASQSEKLGGPTQNTGEQGAGAQSVKPESAAQNAGGQWSGHNVSPANASNNESSPQHFNRGGAPTGRGRGRGRGSTHRGRGGRFSRGRN